MICKREEVFADDRLSDCTCTATSSTRRCHRVDFLFSTLTSSVHAKNRTWLNYGLALGGVHALPHTRRFLGVLAFSFVPLWEPSKKYAGLSLPWARLNMKFAFACTTAPSLSALWPSSSVSFRI
eukprot:scaffold236236_cov39-Tisochrysis_lutea.AAC.1